MATKIDEKTIDGWGNKFILYAEETSTSISNNTSSVKTWIDLYVVSGGYVESYGIKVACTGKSEQDLGYKYYNPGTHRLVEGTQTFNHNADGSGSASVSGYFHSGIGNWDLSGSLTLTKLARQSKINSFVGNDIKGNFSATYTAYSQSYENRLKIKIHNGPDLQTFSNYVSGTDVQLSSSAINTIKNYTSAKTITLGGIIKTYSGSTLVGDSSELTITCTIKKPAKIRINGAWVDAVPYVRVNGQWKEATPYTRVNGVWKEEN